MKQKKRTQFKMKYLLFAFISAVVLTSIFYFSKENIISAQETEIFTLEDAKLLQQGKLLGPELELDGLSYHAPLLNPDEDQDGDGLLTKEELGIRIINGRRAVIIKSHPMLKDTDGDGLTDKQELDSGKNPLIWDVSSRDMAMFMRLAYHEDDYINKVLDHKNELTDLFEGHSFPSGGPKYKMMYNELSPYWKIKKTYHVDKNGFDAVLFETKSDHYFLPDSAVYVVAIRGTTPGNTRDLYEDTFIATGGRPNQAFETPIVLDEIAKMNPKQVYATGHSLGGWLAQYMAAYAEVEGRYPWFKNAYTFNAPNIRANAFQKRDFKNIRDKSYDLSERGISKHYAVSNDFVTRATGRMPNFIDIGSTYAAHDSDSYYEDSVSNRKDFQQGERNTMNGVGRRSELLKEAFKLKSTPTKDERPRLNELFPAEKKKEGNVDIYNPISVNQVKELLLNSLKPVPSRPHNSITWEAEPILESTYGEVLRTNLTFFYPDSTSSQVEITYRYLVDKAPIENLWNEIQTRLQRGQTNEKFNHLYRPSSLKALNRWKENERLNILRSLSEAISNDRLTPSEADNLLANGRASYERLIEALSMRERVIDKSPLAKELEVITQMLSVDMTNKTPKSIEAFTQKLEELGKDNLLNDLQIMTSNSSIAQDATQEQVDELNRRATQFIEQVSDAIDLLKEKGDTSVLENELSKLREQIESDYNPNYYINDEARIEYERERVTSSDVVNNVEELLKDRDNLTREDIETPLQMVRTHFQSLIEKRQALQLKFSKQALENLYQSIISLKDGINEQNYTPNSYTNYIAKLEEGKIQDKINKAKSVIDDENAKKSQVNEVLNELQEAYNNLEKAIATLQQKANKDKLNELIEKFNQLEQGSDSYISTHTPISVARYKELIQNEKKSTNQKAVTLVSDDNATQEEVATMQIQLQESIDRIEKEKLNLQPIVDKQGLIQVIQTVRSLISQDAIESLDLDRFTPISKKNYINEMGKLNVEDKLTIATIISSNDNASNEEVNEQVILLNELIESIQRLRDNLIPQANFEQLSILIKRLEDLISQDYQRERYTKVSYDSYNEAREQASEKFVQAKELLNDLNSTQQAVTSMEQEISSKIIELNEKIKLLEERPDLTEVVAYKDILASFKNLDLSNKTLTSREDYLRTLTEIGVDDLLNSIVEAENNENLTLNNKVDLLNTLQEKHAQLLEAQAKLQDRADTTSFKEKLDELKNLLNEDFEENIYTRKTLNKFNEVRERLLNKATDYEKLLEDENLVQEKVEQKEVELVQDIKLLKDVRDQLALKPSKKALELLLNELLDIQALDIQPYTIKSRTMWNDKFNEVDINQKIAELRMLVEGNEDDETVIFDSVARFEELKNELILVKSKLVLHLDDTSSYIELARTTRELQKTKEYVGTSENLKLVLEEKLALLEAIIETPEAKNIYSVAEAEEIKNNLLLAIRDVQLEIVSILSIDLGNNRKIQILDPTSGLKGYRLKANPINFSDGELSAKKYEAFEIYLESLVIDEHGNYPRLSITPNFRLTLPRLLGEEVQGVYYVTDETPYALEKIAEKDDIIVTENDVTFTIQHLSTYAVVYSSPETPDNGGETKPEAPDNGGETKPETPDNGGETKPETPDNGGETKPETPDNAGDSSPNSSSINEENSEDNSYNESNERNVNNDNSNLDLNKKLPNTGIHKNIYLLIIILMTLIITYALITKKLKRILK